MTFCDKIKMDPRFRGNDDREMCGFREFRPAVAGQDDSPMRETTKVKRSICSE